jgi:glycosyltransferase involved in cell wall biosynthesis
MEKNNAFDFVLLMPCYDNFPGLIESLNSVSYKNNNYLILIVDDGSKESIKLPTITFQLKHEKPIFILTNEKNLGITEALNKGLSWIEKNTISKYIARLDCGDICINDRFEHQVNFLDNHPEIGLVGSYCLFKDEKTGIRYTYKGPQHHKKILKKMYFKNVFMHATVMFRTSLLEKIGYYPYEFEYAEDYAFFWKLTSVTETSVMDKVLVVCKINRKGISFKNRAKQFAARRKVVTAFSDNQLLKAVAFLKLKMLLILPKSVVLWLKGKQ